MKMRTLTTLIFFTCLTANADWVADPANEKQVAAAEAIEQIKQRIPRAQTFFDEAYGMVVYPSVTRAGLGFGGATGKGFVIEGDVIIGTSRYYQFTSGIQAGVRNFSMVVLFKNKESLDYFKLGKAEFMGQSGLAAGSKGIAGTPSFNDGVAIFTVTRLGLMGEFTVSGAKFSFKPLPDTGDDSE